MPRNLIWAGILTLSAVAGASSIDPRETEVMSNALQTAGAALTVTADTESRSIEKIDCLHSRTRATGTTDDCHFVDASDGKPLELTAAEANVFSILVGHYGGEVKQWTVGTSSYREITAASARCERAAGSQGTWVCEVQ